MKDIFVDCDTLHNFFNPADTEYRKFIKWLIEEGSLVISKKILGEYTGACGDAKKEYNIIIIIDRQTREGRINMKKKEEIKLIKFKNHQVKKFKSNRKDHHHIKLVMASFRKFAISEDTDFRFDINNCPGHSARAEKRPEHIPYAD